MQTIEDRLKSDFFNQPEIKIALKKQLHLIEDGKTTPFVAAEYLLKLKN
jgi:LAO/AO transport system kinase